MICLEACKSSLACEQKMTNEYIESSCGLINGVRFEELNVDTFNLDGQPKIYKVLYSYSANPFANGPANKVKDRIYFNDQTVTWWTDTSTNGIYRNYGNSRELLNKVEQTSVTVNQNEGKQEMTSSIKFKSGTWYYISFHTYYAAYLYVDENMNYTINTIITATNY